MDDESLGAYHSDLAAAFVRGRLGNVSGGQAEVVAAGRAAGLRVHRFKRHPELPRVRAALGALRSFAPTSLLDVGSGRGTFLWPLLETFPAMPVTAIDTDPTRARDLAAVGSGGIERLDAVCADVWRLPFRAGAFDLVTVLEVLEHLPDPACAVAT
jgi:2-polyprenyl-3-methyl-5-hydroxy-6-metoxy-1,4-benzoquinol methylase